VWGRLRGGGEGQVRSASATYREGVMSEKKRKTAKLGLSQASTAPGTASAASFCGPERCSSDNIELEMGLVARHM
jgi:hypothetical protein